MKFDSSKCSVFRFPLQQTWVQRKVVRIRSTSKVARIGARSTKYLLFYHHLRRNVWRFKEKRLSFVSCPQFSFSWQFKSHWKKLQFKSRKEKISMTLLLFRPTSGKMNRNQSLGSSYRKTVTNSKLCSVKARWFFIDHRRNGMRNNRHFSQIMLYLV